MYLAFFLIVAGIALSARQPYLQSGLQLQRTTYPTSTKEANKNLAHFQHTLNKHGIHVHFIKQGKTALQTLGEKVTKGAGSIVTFSGERAQRSRRAPCSTSC